ncbi:hypothetical protein GCM10007421_16890 [Halopseudomonas oceani]|uniref:JmjC domain-containing protein n=1 Tax=Halopseudomonas oceani TaxID=1708783 RepID=A0A2P4ESL6_9GAMM|nr:cupin domain-containing protein [Halopseudomonas oceani]POB02040.1 hypothetical protein C1949_14425 [Halopseudomonas oceani]GGE43304.1 hypothetical protein GCM10007421_16890 [Halopseudomonas oceani]
MSNVFTFLFGEIEKDIFLENFFQKEPLLIKGEASKFQTIFDIETLNSILNTHELTYPKTRVTDHNNTIHKYNLIDDKDRYENNKNDILNREKILHAIARGGTLVVDRIQEHCPELENLVDMLSNEIHTRISVNGYYTAKNNKGVNPHFDRHDVLALQVHGSKRWYFKKDKHILGKAIRHQPAPAVNEELTDWSSVLLEQGDIFYCPRGLWHFTKTEDEHSAHLAFGLYPLTLAEWLHQLKKDDQISSLLEEYVRHPFQPENSKIRQEAVQAFARQMLATAEQPFDLGLTFRPYMELE